MSNNNTTITSIYDDIAALTERVTALENQATTTQSNISSIQGALNTVQDDVADMKPIALVEGTNLNNLGIGTYYIPDVTTSETIVNKPVTANSNAAIIVLNGAANGELQQWYFINTKNVTKNNKVYHRYFYDNEWSDWLAGYLELDDTGWMTLPLASGIGQHDVTNFPCRYRKIGNRVWVEGCVNGFAEIEKVVATLPEGYRPSKSFYFQNATNGGKTDTFVIRAASGQIQRVSTTLPTLATDNYHFINMSYLVD